MNVHTDMPCWNSELDFSSFAVSANSNSGASNRQIRSRLNKAITQSLLHQETEVDSKNIYLDDLSKSQILSLYSRGYELHQIVQEIFNLSRADGRKYKRVRDMVHDFITSFEVDDSDDD